MAINKYFGDFRNEQKLLNDLTIETIQAMGRDVYYIPREYVKLDRLFGEDILSKFTYAYPIEMYVQDTYSFGGQSDVVSKFGIEITDRLTLQVSITRFNDEICTKNSDITRPREGDLVYFPLSKHLFEINFVKNKIPFYQHGALTTYTLVCELFTYSSETIDTGNTDIDIAEDQRKMFLTKMTLGTSNTSGYFFKRGDMVFQVDGVTNGAYANKTYSATVADFIPGNTNYLYVSDESGTLKVGSQTIIKNDGSTNYYVIAKTDTNINVTKDPQILESSGDNAQIDMLKSSNDLFDFSDIDPFSEGKY